MAVCSKLHTIGCHKLGKVTALATHHLLEHLHAVHRLHTVNLPHSIFLMMKQIRLQLSVRILLERGVQPAVLTLLLLHILTAQITVVAPHLEELRQTEILILPTHLHRDTEHTRMDERRLFHRQLHICGKQGASLLRAHLLIVLLHISEYVPRRIGGMRYGCLHRGQKVIPRVNGL